MYLVENRSLQPFGESKNLLWNPLTSQSLCPSHIIKTVCWINKQRHFENRFSHTSLYRVYDRVSEIDFQLVNQINSSELFEFTSERHDESGRGVLDICMEGLGGTSIAPKLPSIISTTLFMAGRLDGHG